MRPSDPTSSSRCGPTSPKRPHRWLAGTWPATTRSGGWRERAPHHPHPRRRHQAAPDQSGREPRAAGGPGRVLDVGYLEFLDLVLGEETGIREGRRFRNALKLSGLPHHKTLDEFDFAFQPELDPRKVKDLATLGFVEARANVAFLGPPGVGKDHAGGGAGRRRLPGRVLDLLHNHRRHGAPARRGGDHRAVRQEAADLPHAVGCWCSTRSATCRCHAPRPTWSSS